MIARLKERIEQAYSKLISIDGILFDNPIEENMPYDSRKLHEVCINHKLAIYLDEFILPLLNDRYDSYFTDIEFNREGVNAKNVNINNSETLCRPDIIIHNRISGNRKNNFLIVECKKSESSRAEINADEKKIIGFLNDDRYLYEYGLQTIYHSTLINGFLFYKNEGKILTEEIIVRND
jgi:hypothetical protein